MHMKWYTMAIGWAMVLLGLLTTGALGFKTDRDCNYLFGADEAICLHEAAISFAAVGDTASATTMCDRVGAAAVSTARGQSDMCYSDVAQLAEDASICNYISISPTDSLLFGSRVTKENCQSAVAARMGTHNYQCALFFFLPALVLVTIVVARSRQE